MCNLQAKRSLDDADNKLKSLQRETAELQLEEWRASVLYDQSIDEHPQVKDTEEASAHRPMLAQIALIVVLIAPKNGGSSIPCFIKCEYRRT
jgi:hypothetical protein